jgi:hypothetical protein
MTQCLQNLAEPGANDLLGGAGLRGEFVRELVRAMRPFGDET